MKEEKEILNRSINKGEKALGRVFPKRVSEKEYTGGYYLPKQDLHQILETLFKLKLKSQDEEGNAGYLVAKKQKHPNLFWLVDSVEARRDLRVLIPLLDYLSQLQKMPDNMCDLNKFEDAMALDPKQIRPAVKKAILERITYIDTDGKEKPLVQFYVEKKLHNDKDVYGVCVPRTAKGQKALLELAGFKIQTYETQNIFTERERIIIEKRYKGLTLEYIGKLFNVNSERIRQIEAKALRKLRRRFEIQDKSEPEEHSSTDKNALYMKDSEGDFIITQTAFNQGYLKCPSHRSLSKSKQKIIKFDRESRE